MAAGLAFNLSFTKELNELNSLTSESFFSKKDLYSASLITAYLTTVGRFITNYVAMEGKLNPLRCDC